LTHRDHYFEIDFKVERMGVNELGEEEEVEWNGEGDGCELGQEGKHEFEQERSPKRRRNSTVTGEGVIVRTRVVI
jgi:hypothetical protein